MTSWRLFCCLFVPLFGMPAFALAASDGDAEGLAFFESKIRPVFAKHCYKCHSVKAGESKGGLRLDSGQGIHAGGDQGRTVVPGDPGASLLYKAISRSDPDLEMPPDADPLPPRVVADVKKWIEMGAPAPAGVDAPRPPVTIEAGRAFWAYKKPERVEPPETDDPDWARRDLDHFILARLMANGLSPSADAKPSVLLRRLHFDLVGLPPSPNDKLKFLERIDAAGLDAAMAKEVDKLLASEHFGERWGRHWLDVARFAESSGKETNVSFPHAWRYRDYVIDAFNEDRPYDRFLTEQIAGDLLPYESDEQRAEQLVATGFLAVGPKGLNEMNPFQFIADVVDEQIDALSRAVMATSVACARCHDHKFDPFTMLDYYALAGIFVSTKAYFGTSVAPGNQVGGDLLHLPEIDGQLVPNKSMPEKRVKALKDELAALKQEGIDRRAAAKEAIAEGKDPSEFFSLRDALRILWRSGGIEGKLKAVDDTGRAYALTMGVADREEIHDAPLLERGEIDRAGDRVPRGFPAVVELSNPPTVPSDQSGRLQLAQWLTHPEHPLTARVMANRVWRHLLGAGIVRTVDNFGFNGERPSHPELLDHLTTQFVDEGWSIKSLVREIALSRTYRQASTFDEPSFETDPENRLLWRASKRRLDAEVIRDAMLAVAGNLETDRPDASLVARIGDRPISLIAFDKRVPPDLDGSEHRSVYLPVIRDRLPDVLDLFDFAEPSLVTGHRETTNVPLQALYLMNSPFVQDQATGLARRVTTHRDHRDEQIRHAFQLCFNRDPDDTELRDGQAFFADQSSDDLPVVMSAYCQALLAAAEFRNLD